MKKLFGGIDLSWKKVIIGAIIAGAYTALMAIIPQLLYTSFIAITSTFEVWILFGIIIIMNSKSNKDAALKCFVFFLISQPLVYLLQVPFSRLGWELFGYYKYWFIWTILCLPMGYIGYYMKKDKWWGYLILFPMILLTAFSYMSYFPNFMFSYPKYILVLLFCACAMIIYPLYIFNNKKIRIFGVIISCILLVGISAYSLTQEVVYEPIVLTNTSEHPFDDTCKAYILNEKLGEVKIEYNDKISDYVIQASFKHEGKTQMILESIDKMQKKYDLDIKKTTYEVTPIN